MPDRSVEPLFKRRRPIQCEREGCDEPMRWHIGLTALCAHHIRELVTDDA